MSRRGGAGFVAGFGGDERALCVSSETYREAFEVIGAACEQISRGDLEARVPPLPGGADLQRVRTQINGLIDITDAFVRESMASLRAAGEGRFHRLFLAGGMTGSFRYGANTINTARQAMAASAARLDAERRNRAELVDRAHEVSEQVATASTELGASAVSLATSAGSAVDTAHTVLDTVGRLEDSATRIHDTVGTIKRVAAQTRLLALNASIEAARAAEAGRGFAVVANEVKTLADEITRSSEGIDAQVAAVQQMTIDAVNAIRRITEVIEEMDVQVGGIATAAGGGATGGGTGAAGGGVTGLAEMAEMLRMEINNLVATGS